MGSDNTYLCLPCWVTTWICFRKTSTPNKKLVPHRPTLDSLSIMSHIPWRIHGAGILMLTWLGYIDGIHGTPYMAAPWITWIRHGYWENDNKSLIFQRNHEQKSWKIYHWNFRLRDREWTTTSKRCGREEVVTNRGEVTVLRWNRRIGKTEKDKSQIHRTWINWHPDLPWFSEFYPLVI